MLKGHLPRARGSRTAPRARRPRTLAKMLQGHLPMRHPRTIQGYLAHMRMLRQGYRATYPRTDLPGVGTDRSRARVAGWGTERSRRVMLTGE